MGIDQCQVQPEARGDRWIKEVIEIATEDPGCVHSHTMDEAQVDQIRAGVMRRADSLADLADTPSGKLQADEKGLGEPGVEVGPVADEAVVEVPAHLGAGWIGQDAVDPCEIFLPRSVAAYWYQSARLDARQCDHRGASRALV